MCAFAIPFFNFKSKEFVGRIAVWGEKFEFDQFHSSFTVLQIHYSNSLLAHYLFNSFNSFNTFNAFITFIAVITFIAEIFVLKNCSLSKVQALKKLKTWAFHTAMNNAYVKVMYLSSPNQQGIH